MSNKFANWQHLLLHLLSVLDLRQAFEKLNMCVNYVFICASIKLTIASDYVTQFQCGYSAVVVDDDDDDYDDYVQVSMFTMATGIPQDHSGNPSLDSATQAFIGTGLCMTWVKDPRLPDIQ